ncbi:unnamed protein product [Dibothriocephalus latus]|uniref:Uncharacterized protein n=1 Tax=Dibothriocephalus latus TaxID=60516 RepID=A0A3P7LMS1_DIBLA|nr:unnamed protein product [Dibothriocephalus latus]
MIAQSLLCEKCSPSAASELLSVLNLKPDCPFRDYPCPFLTPHYPTLLFTTSNDWFFLILSPRRLAPTRLAAAKAELERMLKLGIIRQPESP